MSQDFKLKYQKELQKDKKFRKGDFKSHNEEPSKTRTEFAKDCDINRIVNKYLQSGILPPNNHSNLGMYADVSALPDFRSVLDFMITAKENFRLMSPDIRKRFRNDPDALMSFLNDPSNRAEAVKLGLVNPDTGNVIKEPSPLGEGKQSVAPLVGEKTEVSEKKEAK